MHGHRWMDQEIPQNTHWSGGFSQPYPLDQLPNFGRRFLRFPEIHNDIGKVRPCQKGLQGAGFCGGLRLKLLPKGIRDNSAAGKQFFSGHVETLHSCSQYCFCSHSLIWYDSVIPEFLIMIDTPPLFHYLGSWKEYSYVGNGKTWARHRLRTSLRRKEGIVEDIYVQWRSWVHYLP
jgi:hypothetical protein